MKTLVLKDLVQDSSSNNQGTVLFDYLKKAKSSGEPILLEVSSDLALSSSFLNSSIGMFLEEYGINSFRETIKFKGSKNQFTRLSKYIQTYSELYLA